MQRLKILYVGPLWKGSTSLQRYRTLLRIGHDCTGVDTEPTIVRKLGANLGYRAIRKICGIPDIARANQKIARLATTQKFDLCWLDKALTISRETMQLLKRSNTIIVGYSPDDMNRKQNQSKRFLEHLDLYDIFATTKSFGVNELEKLGCRKALFVKNAFDPETHYPRAVSAYLRDKFGGTIGFIGEYEPARACDIQALCNADLQVRVWGNGWNYLKSTDARLIIEGRSVWSEEYAEALSNFDINLCFLRKLNRDLQTTRSVEIPACGGFMLAQRTEEHLSLFTEGVEAEFFSSHSELIEKTIFYLQYPERRKEIAAAGLQRCLTSDYSYDALLSFIIHNATNA